MLANVLLGLVIALIASVGGLVVWLVAAEILDPFVAAIGSTCVLIGCTVSLVLLFMRQRQRRMQQELHTVRRSQMVRERQPETYGDLPEDTPEAPAPLVHALPGASTATDTDANEELDSVSEARVSAALDADRIDLFLEPVVAMPSNETAAFRALPGLSGSSSPLPPSRAMSDALRVRVERDVLDQAMSLARTRLEGIPVHCDVSRAFLSDDEAVAHALRGYDEAGKPEVAIRLADAELDALEAGRLADLAQAGFGLVLVVEHPGATKRSEAAEMAARGAGYVVVNGPALIGNPQAALGMRHLMEAGFDPIAENVATEEQMLDLADLRIAHYAGPLFGEPRRVRSEHGEIDLELRERSPVRD